MKNVANLKNDVYQKVADRLIEMIDNNVIPWRKPWKQTAEDGGSMFEACVSYSTGKPYSFLNQILCEFREGQYITFAQAKKVGGNVKRGAKGYPVVFWSFVEKDATDQNGNKKYNDRGEVVKTSYPVLKWYHVFNVEDCENIPERKKVVVPDDDSGDVVALDPIQAAEDLAHNYVTREGITLNIGKSNRAYFQPSSDTVVLPELSQFTEVSEYYSTMFHELTHSTGVKTRLNRDEMTKIVAFGDQDYSREELTAEMGAAFILGRLGIQQESTVTNSAAYLQGWRKAIKNDPKCVVLAAGRAEKAANYIFNGKSQEDEEGI
jgi:antirestriction protein ArdC